MATLTASTSASEACPSNASRKSLTIQNEDATDVLYIKRERGELLTVSATDHDIKLGPGTAMSLSSQADGIQAIQARYTVIAGANTPRYAVFESEDIVR